jgi:hypothetical protein
MTTSSWAAIIAHGTDADFRAWGADYKTHLAAIGCVQTADTGQINWATATRPTTPVNTAAGYEIWRFNDALQATAPIFFKLEYGTGGSTNAAVGSQAPGMWLTVGTGSDGAGNITGVVSVRRQLHTTSSGTSTTITTTATTTPSQSYFCHAAGFLGCIFHYGSTLLIPWGSFAIVRYCDNNGAPIGDGFVVYWCCFSTETAALVAGCASSVRTASPSAGAMPVSNGNYAMFPHKQINSLDENGNIQAFGHWAPTLKMKPLFAMCSLFNGEVAIGNTFQTALVGTTLRTFISTGPWLIQAADGFRGAMLWE